MTTLVEEAVGRAVREQFYRAVRAVDEMGDDDVALLARPGIGQALDLIIAELDDWERPWHRAPIEDVS